MFDPGGSTGRLRAYSLLGTWRASICGEVFVWALDEAAACFFWRMDDLESSTCRKGTDESFTPCGRSLFLRSQAVLKMSCTRSSEQWGERVSENAMERGD